MGSPYPCRTWVVSRKTPALALVALALAVSGACAPSQGPQPARGTIIRVQERDFNISAPGAVPTGDLLLQVRNRGPDSHELLVVRINGRLPLRRDDLTVDEEALDAETVGILEPGEAGSVRQLRVHLTPGHYQLFCNMAGHYMAGMHREMVVR